MSMILSQIESAQGHHLFPTSCLFLFCRMLRHEVLSTLADVPTYVFAKLSSQLIDCVDFQDFTKRFMQYIQEGLNIAMQASTFSFQSNVFEYQIHRPEIPAFNKTPVWNDKSLLLHLNSMTPLMTNRQSSNFITRFRKETASKALRQETHSEVTLASFTTIVQTVQIGAGEQQHYPQPNRSKCTH